MKKQILILSAISVLASPVCAELTIDDTVSDAYLKNHGHSDASINAVNYIVATTAGEKYEEPVEKEYYESNVVVKYLRKFFMYIDPGLDSHSFANGRSINTTTKYSDL